MMAISERVVDDCGLEQIGTERVHYADGSAKDVPKFLINIGLPNGVAFAGRTATLGNPGDADVLIGMDIIRRGDFVVTNGDGRTKFSFRIPSLATIDFVEEDTRANSPSRPAGLKQSTPKQSTRGKNRQKRKGKKGRSR